MPVSRTVSCMLSRVPDSSTRISPSSVYLNALESRFSTIHRNAHSFFDRTGGHRLRGNHSQDAQLPFADYAIRDFRDDAQHAGNAAGIVIYWAVGKGAIGFLGKSAALEKQQQRLVPGSIAAGQYLTDTGPDFRPDLLPHAIRARPEHPIPLDANGRQVGVIAKKREFRTPEHPHG